MKNLMTLMCFAALAGSALSGTLVQNKDDGRTWQTVFNPSAPLEWRWEANAASARIEVTNLLDNSVAVAAVTKGSTAYGSHALDYAAGAGASGEALYDVVLMQLDANGAAVDVQTARLACLPASFTVAREDRLAKVKGRRTVAYDAAWKAETADATSAYLAFKPKGGSSASAALSGTGGYAPSPAESGVLTLGFDSTDAWTGDVLLSGGLMLFFR